MSKPGAAIEQSHFSVTVDAGRVPCVSMCIESRPADCDYFHQMLIDLDCTVAGKYSVTLPLEEADRLHGDDFEMPGWYEEEEEEVKDIYMPLAASYPLTEHDSMGNSELVAAMCAACVRLSEMYDFLLDQTPMADGPTRKRLRNQVRESMHFGVRGIREAVVNAKTLSLFCAAFQHHPVPMRILHGHWMQASIGNALDPHGALGGELTGNIMPCWPAMSHLLLMRVLRDLGVDPDAPNLYHNACEFLLSHGMEANLVHLHAQLIETVCAFNHHDAHLDYKRKPAFYFVQNEDVATEGKLRRDWRRLRHSIFAVGMSEQGIFFTPGSLLIGRQVVAKARRATELAQIQHAREPAIVTANRRV